MKSVEVFISYHQNDEDLREELEKHLASLQREKTITSWSDRKIVAGQEFTSEINKYLNQAGLILLLVSPDFIASEYHWTVEVTRALEQNAAGKASVIPVLLRYADWETPPIDKLSPLPKNREPIISSNWNNRDQAFLEVVKGIREEVKRLVANSNYSPPQQTSQELDERQYEVTSLINEADRLYKDKNFEEAARKYKAALRLEPNSVLAHNHLGSALHHQGKLDEAFACYQKALRIDPNYAEAHYGLGSALYDQGKLDQAIASYEKALQIDPNYAEAHYGLGLALYTQGKLDQAIASYEKALQIDPNFAYAHYGLGLALYTQGKLDQAIASYEKALQIDPNFAHAHFTLGNALYTQGKVYQAIASYQKALEIDPNDVYAHNSLGWALYEQGKLDEAIASYQKALEIDPNYTKLPKIELFGIKLPTGLAFEQIIRSKTTWYYAYVHNNLGIALYKQGKLDEAIASYRKALQIDPNFAQAHNNLGYALYNQGKLDKAIASYRKALQIDPNFAQAHNDLGYALYNQGKLDKAIAELEIAVRLDPSSTLFRENLESVRNKKKGFWGRLFGG